MFQRKRWGGVGKAPRGFVCSFLLLIFVAASLLFPLSARAESGQADLDGLAPYADDGDLDYIPDYFVTVDLREDGSADIVYDITWQVIGGDQTDYLSWVKIGLPNAHAEDLTPLTDTISDLQYTGDGGSYAKVVFARRYYSPEVAAQNGGESRVRFAFSVHQNHLFTLNDDGTATFEFTPGWFDDLVVEHMQVRWRSGDGFVADNSSEEDGYLIWEFGPMGHGQSANIHVTVPVTTAETFDPDAQLTAADYDDGGMTADEMLGILTVVIGLLIFAAALIIIFGSMNTGLGRRLRQRAGPGRLVLVHQRRTHHPCGPHRPAPQGLHPHRPAEKLPYRRRFFPRRRRGAAQQRVRFQLRLRLCFQLRVCLRLCGRRPCRMHCKRFLHVQTAP